MAEHVVPRQCRSALIGRWTSALKRLPAGLRQQLEIEGNVSSRCGAAG